MNSLSFLSLCSLNLVPTFLHNHVLSLMLKYLLQVSVVGDFTEEEVESCVLDYLGTVRAANSSNTVEHIEKISFLPFPSDLHSQQVCLYYHLIRYSIPKYKARYFYAGL